MKTYMAYRKNGRVVANVIVEDRFSPLHHYVYHSPTGFEYGFEGSGPADLALAILADYFDEKPEKSALSRGGVNTICMTCKGRKCIECDWNGYLFQEFKSWIHHQTFKRDFLGKAKSSEPLMISEEQITDWLRGVAA